MLQRSGGMRRPGAAGVHGGGQYGRALGRGSSRGGAGPALGG